MTLTLPRPLSTTLNWFSLLFVLLSAASGCGASREAQSLNSVRPLEQSLQSETGRSLTDDQLSPHLFSAATAFEQGRQSIRTEQYEQAATWFERAIQLDDARADYYLWLGRAYGRQAEQADAGNQFFLARKVRKNLEKAVQLNPDLVEARFDLMSYYLQAPGLLGGGAEKAQTQAAEIAKRDAQQGKLAWQQCQQAREQEVSLFTLAGN